MDAIQISGEWYVIRDNGDGSFSVVDGPYPEKHWAESMNRLREI